MRLRTAAGGVLVLLLLSGCRGSAMSMLPKEAAAVVNAGTGAYTTVRGALASAGATAELIATNLRAWIGEGERRVQDVREGIDKMQEGKEQIERGVRGE